MVETQSPARLAAWVVARRSSARSSRSIVLLLVWRLVAVGQAFLDTRRSGPTGRLGVVGIVIIAIVVVLPHLVVYRFGTALGDTFDRIFDGEVLGAADQRGAAARPIPSDGQRINVLLVGVDQRGREVTNLTDTMMVASLDPVGHTVSLVSIPRDLIGTPLGNGDTFGPKLNSLMAYADTHPKTFPNGGMRTLEDAVGALLEIPIHYYARVHFGGFIKMVDAVGGVDIDVPHGFSDPEYDGYRSEKGYAITAGPHHFDGAEALAYARSRKGAGESDFTRQARQQQILVALRERATQGGSLLFQLPGLLEAVGQTIRSDVPAERLPELAAITQEVGRSGLTSVVIRAPLVRSTTTRYGDSQAPDLDAIRAMAAELFSDPGVKPVPWPAPKASKPGKTAKPTASP